MSKPEFTVHCSFYLVFFFFKRSFFVSVHKINFSLTVLVLIFINYINPALYLYGKVQSTQMQTNIWLQGPHLFLQRVLFIISTWWICLGVNHFFRWKKIEPMPLFCHQIVSTIPLLEAPSELRQNTKPVFLTSTAVVKVLSHFLLPFFFKQSGNRPSYLNTNSIQKDTVL